MGNIINNIFGVVLLIIGIGLLLYGIILTIPAFKGEGEYMDFGKAALISFGSIGLMFAGLILLGIDKVKAFFILAIINAFIIYLTGFYTIYLEKISKFDRIILIIVSLLVGTLLFFILFYCLFNV